MNQIEIQYFAVLRERAGTGRETVETAAATAADLYHELAARHDFGLPRAMLRVAVNDEFAEWSRPLAAGEDEAVQGRQSAHVDGCPGTSRLPPRFSTRRNSAITISWDSALHMS